MKSSKNISMNSSKYSLKVLPTIIWNVGGPFLTPNAITIQIKAPQFVTKNVLYISSRAIQIYWYPEFPSKNEQASYPTIMFKTSLENAKR
jgi:hypothetical protein